MNPDEFFELAREKPIEATEFVQDFADAYNNSGSTGYANLVIHIFETFLKVNKIKLDLVGYSQPSRSRKRPEYIPTLLEALKMADMAVCLRDRLAILMLTYTGLRNSTLRATVYDECYLNDPVLQQYTLKREIERKEESLIIIIHEVMKKRIPDSCKNRIFYYVFLPPKVTECFRLHIREIARKVGCIDSNQPIFPTTNTRFSVSKRNKTAISNHQLENIVKDAAQRAGIENYRYVYPHCLRKTFESFMRNQPDELKLDEKEREFFFGHILPGSQDTYFDKTKIEEMRAKYARMSFEPFASFEKEERVIHENELKNYLKGEWHFEATLTSGDVVVFRKSLKKRTENTENIDTAKSVNQKEHIQTRSLQNKKLPIDETKEQDRQSKELTNEDRQKKGHKKR